MSTAWADTDRVLGSTDDVVRDSSSLALQVKVDRLLESAAPSVTGEASPEGLAAAVEISNSLGVDWRAVRSAVDWRCAGTDWCPCEDSEDLA